MYSVSALAKAAGLSVDTVRYYIRLGLLPEAGRTRGGHRFFDERAVERIQFIKGAQWFELSLEEIRELVEITDEGGCACHLTKSLLQQKIAAIDAQRDRLDEVRSELARLLDDNTIEHDGFNVAAMSVGAAFSNGGSSERERLLARRADVVRRLRALDRHRPVAAS